MSNETMWGTQLRLPVQVAPVDRAPETADAIGDPGIAASAWTDLLPPRISDYITDFAPPLTSFI